MGNNRDNLLALADRCEAAEGASFALEQEIWAAAVARPPANLAAVGNIKPPAYTASLDAAMTLKADWLLDYIQEHDEDYSTAGIYRRNPLVLSHDKATGNGKTPALALCAAALRARTVSQRATAMTPSVEDAIERLRATLESVDRVAPNGHPVVIEDRDDLRTLLATLERPAEKEIVGRLYDAAFKARWFVEKASRGAEFTEIGKANAKDVLGLLNTALEAARKQS